MKTKRFYLGICILGMLLALTLGTVLAKDPVDRPQPQEPLTVEAQVSSKFTYQGLLREDGAPVSGTRDMVFHLFSDDACTNPVGLDISRPGVEVNNGLFSVDLSVGHTYINGQGLWLGIQIEGTTVGCQEILPVPYALSRRHGYRRRDLRPGHDAHRSRFDPLVHSPVPPGAAHHLPKPGLGLCLQPYCRAPGRLRPDQPGHRRRSHGLQQPVGRRQFSTPAQISGVLSLKTAPDALKGRFTSWKTSTSVQPNGTITRSYRNGS
jgi:hypothetical protein